MKIELCGQILDIPDRLSEEDQNKLIKKFAEKVINEIPEEIFDDAYDKAWIEVYGELTEERKKEITEKIRQKKIETEKIRRKHAAAGSGIVVLSEDDINIMQEVAKEDEIYRAKKKREREEKEYSDMCTSRMYEVLPGKLFAGPIPSAPNKDHIVAVLAKPVKEWGIRCFINLMEENEVNNNGQPFNGYIKEAKSLADDVEMIRFAIPDYTAPDKETMKKILDVIDEKIAQNIPVYVHCWGGIGRTGVVIGCWLKRHGESDPLAKLQQLRSAVSNRERNSPESKDQYELIEAWEIGK